MPTTAVDDRRVHYRDEGTGDTPVLLLHAFPLDSTMWEPQWLDLGRRYRFVAPDLAGFGESTGPDDPARLTIESWADDVIGLAGALGFDHVTVVGASLGADVALAVARRQRDLVGGLALAGIRVAEPSPEEDTFWAEQAGWIAGGGDVDPVADRLVDEIVGRDSSRRPEVVKQTRTMMGRASRSGWAAGFEALRGRPPVLPDAGKIDVPTLIVAGEHDRAASPDDACTLAEHIPGAGVVVVPDSGHLPNLENPAVFNQALVELLEGRTARRESGRHPWPASPAITR
jgi:3-oxoadipate enol-lactonase